MNITIVQELLVHLAFIVPLATGVTEVIKRAANVTNPRWLPLISTVVGAVTGGVLLGWNTPSLIVGVIGGLAGTGLWEFGKTTVAGK